MALNFNEGARILNAMLAGVAYTPPTNHSLSLHTANPGSTDTVASEVTGGSYARQSIAFGSVTASGNSSAVTASNSGVVTYASMPACTVTNVVIWNNTPGSGTPQANGGLTGGITLTAGQTLTFAAGSLTSQET